MQVLPNIVEHVLENGTGPFHFGQNLLFDYFLNGVLNCETGERQGGWFLKQIKRDSRSGQSLLFGELLSNGKCEKEITAYMNIYAENLAVSLLSQETGQLHQEPLTNEETLQPKLIEPVHFSDLWSDYEPEFYWDKDKNEANANFYAIRSGCILRIYDSRLNTYDTVVSMRFEFLHKSIVEYLVAQRLRKELESYEEDLKTLQVTGKIDESGYAPLMNRVLLRKEPEIIARLTEMVNESYEPLDFRMSKRDKAKKLSLRQILLNILLASKKNPDISMAAANAITILNAVGVVFHQRDLSDIRIPGADLSGIIADEANLSGADLSNVWFYRASLRTANLHGANMSRVQFGEYPYLEVESACLAFAYSLNGRFMAIGVNKDIHLYDVSVNNCLLRIFKGRTNRVTSMDFSLDGRYLASGSSGKDIRLWDLQSDCKLQQLWGPAEEAMSVSFSPDGRQLASGSKDKSVWLWDLQKRRRKSQQLRGHTKGVASVSFSPDGRQLASGSYDESIRIWDPQSGRELQQLQGHTGGVTSVKFSPDGCQLASGSYDRSIRIWDLQSGHEIQQLQHPEAVTSVNFSPDGRRLASGSYDSSVRIWNLQSGHVQQLLQGHSDVVTSVHFSRDGRYLASSSYDESVRLWELRSDCKQQRLWRHTGEVTNVVVSADGRWLASSSKDNSIRIWDLRSGRAQQYLQEHIQWAVTSMSFSADGLYFVSSRWDRKVWLWELPSSMVVNPDECLFASSGVDNSVRLWDFQNGRVQQHSQMYTKYYVESVCLSHDGHYLVLYGDNRVQLWDLQTSHVQPLFQERIDGVKCMDFSPDGTQLALGSRDKSIRIWDFPSSHIQWQLQGHTMAVESVSFSTNGRYLASGSWDGSIRIWDLQSGYLKQRLQDGRIMTKMSFSVDGRYLASGSYDESIRIWDLKSGHLQQQLHGHIKAVTSVSFSIDGRYLASGSEDNSIRVWEGSETVGGKFDVPFKLVWSSHPSTQLELKESDVSEVEGLSSVNQSLLEQRGAKGQPQVHTSAFSSSSGASQLIATWGVFATGQHRQADDAPIPHHSTALGFHLLF